MLSCPIVLDVLFELRREASASVLAELLKYLSLPLFGRFFCIKFHPLLNLRFDNIKPTGGGGP
jgi:hypothetical protein